MTQVLRPLKGRTIALLVEQQYQDLEVWVPYYRLVEAGADVALVGRKPGQVYQGKFGYPCPVTASYGDVSAKALDAVLVPGGFAPDFMRRYPEPARLVAEAFALGRLVAAICHGAWLLCSAGVLRGRSATCFFAIADDVKNAGADYSDQPVVVDGNLITSRKPEDLPAFCAAIVAYLAQQG
ncbi:MAG: type 1 glutamine amidotransferase [Elusimicrobia bacterium]|nr:type 1 glutamine amidotransferase [Elusimicrobiota bacterium]MDE2236702.1 type 1 glutamine amidotransferase [Elusimicrobiota bacterium]MDE2424298.1 type 1 glutamine amidotransferase [Elusimicrobiota bacterium]